MLLERLANACGSTLVRIRRRVRTMKHAHFAKQNDGHPASLPLADLRAQFAKQSLDVAPLDVRARGMREDRGQRTLVLALRGFDGTTNRYCLAMGSVASALTSEPVPICAMRRLCLRGAMSAFPAVRRWATPNPHALPACP